MTRIVLAASFMLGGALAAEAQPTKAHRIGFVSSASASSMTSRVGAFERGLRELGYVEGRNLTTEFRWADGRSERLRGLVDDLIGRKVEVLVVHGVVAADTARRATTAIPIICFGCDDVLASGLVTSLSRPGGNLTGLTVISPEVSGKRLELLREVVPGASRVAVLWNPANPVSVHEMRRTEAAAGSLGMEVQRVGVPDASGLASALASLDASRSDALVVLSDAMLYGRLEEIAVQATGKGLPTVSWTAEFTAKGGLMSYGPDLLALAGRAAGYVDRILNGARPADLPIEQPTKFELAVNLKTARMLRLTVPAPLLERADVIIR